MLPNNSSPIRSLFPLHSLTILDDLLPGSYNSHARRPRPQFSHPLTPVSSLRIACTTAIALAVSSSSWKTSAVPNDRRRFELQVWPPSENSNVVGPAFVPDFSCEAGAPAHRKYVFRPGPFSFLFPAIHNVPRQRDYHRSKHNASGLSAQPAPLGPTKAGQRQKTARVAPRTMPGATQNSELRTFLPCSFSHGVRRRCRTCAGDRRRARSGTDGGLANSA
ncbi:hypothetical protein OH76DRAFT_1115676 [Lentinus brumalis]|uniref:Uncharacterized protein n=1 Tax=Lentinus brumalis TaxID=2498619 RepID=A0A371CV57_9APHY|nr:hypothetical protein OH76DRAFT_1115676 [Polyporus brumalis]